MAKRWYVVEVTSELRAMAELRKLGVDVFRPIKRERGEGAGKPLVVERRMYPGYLFVSLDLSGDDWRDEVGPINAARGVFHTLPERQERPLPVRRGDVERLLADDLERASLTLEEFLRSTRRPAFAEGTKVRVVEGLASGFEAVIVEDEEGAERLKVDIHGKVTSLLASQVEAAA